MYRKVFYCSFIRSSIKGYLNFCVSAFIGLQYVIFCPILILIQQIDFSNSSSQLSSIISILFIIGCFLLPYCAIYILFKNFKSLGKRKFYQSYGSFYLNTKIEKKALFFIWIFLVRRFLYALIIVNMQNYPGIQLISSMLLSYFTLIYLVIVKPIIGNIDFFFELFNEFMIYIITLFSYTFSDLLEDPILRYEIGFFLVGLVLLTMLFNWVALLIRTGIFVI